MVDSNTKAERASDRPFSQSEKVSSSKRRTFSMPKTEVEEGDTYYLLSLTVPGIPRENIRLEVIDNKELLVEGESNDHRTFFERVFLIPRPVDTGKIEATHGDNELYIILPKSQEVRSNVIPISGEKKSSILERIRRAVG